MCGENLISYHLTAFKHKSFFFLIFCLAPGHQLLIEVTHIIGRNTGSSLVPVIRILSNSKIKISDVLGICTVVIKIVITTQNTVV